MGLKKYKYCEVKGILTVLDSFLVEELKYHPIVLRVTRRKCIYANTGAQVNQH